MEGGTSIDPSRLARLLLVEERTFADRNRASLQQHQQAKLCLLAGVPMHWMVRLQSAPAVRAKDVVLLLLATANLNAGVTCQVTQSLRRFQTTNALLERRCLHPAVTSADLARRQPHHVMLHHIL